MANRHVKAKVNTLNSNQENANVNHGEIELLIYLNGLKKNNRRIPTAVKDRTTRTVIVKV